MTLTKRSKARDKARERQLRETRGRIRKHLRGTLLAAGVKINLDLGDGTTHGNAVALERNGDEIHQRMLCKHTCTNGGREQTVATMAVLCRSLAEMVAARMGAERDAAGLSERIEADLMRWNYYIKTSVKHQVIAAIRDEKRAASLGMLFCGTGMSKVKASLMLGLNQILKERSPASFDLDGREFKMDLDAAKDALLSKTLPAAKATFLKTLDDIARLDPESTSAIHVCVSGNGTRSLGVSEWLDGLTEWVSGVRPDLRRTVRVLEFPTATVGAGEYVAFGAAHARMFKARSDELCDGDCGILLEAADGREVYVRLTPSPRQPYALPHRFAVDVPMVVHDARDKRVGERTRIGSTLMDVQVVCLRTPGAVEDRQPIPAGVEYATYTVAVEVPRGMGNGSPFRLAGCIESDRTIEMHTQVGGEKATHHAYVIGKRVGVGGSAP